MVIILEINKSLFWVFSKYIYIFVLVGHYLSIYKKNKKKTWPPDVKNLNWTCQQFLETTIKFGRLKSDVPDITAQEFDENFLDSKHVLKVYFKNKDFVFLPVPILPVCVKIGHNIT
jgi:hypothetical protein